MRKFELTAPNAFVRCATIIDDPALGDVRLQELHSVRYELSLPTGFDNKKITEWGVRLILGSIPNNPAEFTIRKDAPNAPATVEVEPKIGTF